MSGFLIAFNLIIVYFHNVRYMDIVLVGFQGLAESGNAFRVAENVGGAGDDSHMYLAMGHKPQKTCRGGTASGIVAAHIGDTPGMFNVRVQGHHGDPLAVQDINAFPDPLVIEGGQGFHAAGNLFYGHGTVIACKFLCFFRDTCQHIDVEGILRGEKDDPQLQFFLLGSQHQPGSVGPVVQIPCDFFYFPGGVRMDCPPVVENPVHGAPGHPCQCGDFLDGGHWFSSLYPPDFSMGMPVISRRKSIGKR